MGILLLLSEVVRPRIKHLIGRLLLPNAVESGSRKNNKHGTKRSLNMVNQRLVAAVERRESGEKMRWWSYLHRSLTK